MIDFLFLLISSVILLLGAYGSYQSLPFFLCLFCTGFFVGVKLVQGQKLRLPEGFIWYGLFVLSVLIQFLLLGGDLLFFELFFSGGLFWFIAFNTQKTFSKYFFPIVLSIGFLMFAEYIVSIREGAEYLPQNLYHTVSPEIKHNHLGDLWAIIMVLVVYKMSQKVKIQQIVLMIFGVFVLAVSLSRSALLSLATGSIFIVYSLRERGVFKKMVKPVLWLLLLLFLYFAFFKSTLFARPYYWQAIEVILKHPLGVGYGNFSQFQNETSLVHNIFLEVLLGGGIFSIFFFVWLFKAYKIFMQKSKKTVYKALFLALLINFSFDITYAIPTMVWLWFTTIALMEKITEKL